MNINSNQERSTLFRSLFTILAILLFLPCVNAKTLSVKSIISDMYDLDAGHKMKLDYNDKPCALLKIVLPPNASHAIFEGSIIDKSTDGVETFIYMTSGTKYLTIKVAGYQPLEIDFSDYKQINALEGQQTYKMEIVSNDKKKANATALAYSIIPGLGLIQKGRTGEGVSYLIGDVALVGAGIGLNLYSTNQKKVMNSANATYDQYKRAKDNSNAAKSGSYICYGAAAGVYVLNLVRSYIAQPKPNAPLQWAISTDMTPDIGLPTNNIPSFNLSLCYTF